MIDALVSGKLHADPQQRTSKAGRPYTTATIRAGAGDDSLFIRVTAFDPDVQAALLALKAGDSCALAGSLKPTAWIKDGEARAGADLIAAQCMTLYQLKKRRAADEPQARPERRPQRQQDIGPQDWPDETGGFR